MNNYSEESISKKDLHVNRVIYYILNACMIFFGIASIFFFSTLINSKIPLAISITNIVGFAIGSLLCYITKERMFIEYDYSFTDTDFKVARILNNKRRKDIVDINLRDMVLVAPLQDAVYEKYANNTDKKISAWLNNNSDLYFMAICKGENKYTMLIFEPSREFLESLRRTTQGRVQL